MTGSAARKAAARAATIESSNGNGNGNGNGTVARTTVVFTVALNANWEAFALQTGRAKNEVLAEALARYLEKAGLQPTKLPTVKLSYSP